MASLSLSLRPGDARDAGAVEAVMAAAFDPQWGEAWTRAQLLGVMALPGIHLLLAEMGDEQVVRDCAATGVVTLHLEVRSNNPAILFYTRHGFTKCGERRNYYRGADERQYDAHTYRRAIA